MSTTCSVLIAAMLVAGIAAQTPGDLPALDAATVKPNHGGAEIIYTRVEPGGRFVAAGATLRLLVMSAYSRQTALRIVGGPSWLDSDRFDIVARSEGATPAQTYAMLQRLLADRFRLVVHMETREMPVYELVTLKSGGVAGPGMRVSAASCPPPAPARGSGPPPPPPTTASGALLCGIGGPPGHLSGNGAAPAQLAGTLSARVDRPVFDRTGLTGRFDIELEWTPDTPASQPDTAGAAASTGSSIFTAIQEQLGLTLNAARGAVDVLLIDRAEKPTED